MERRDFDIDLVYLWVDGNDPEWRKRHDEAAGIIRENSAEDCEGRYVDNQELRYSLRSIAKYAPWIRKIFIVTDNQVPHWLDTSNPRIQIIDHKEILPRESLPTFNSCMIEHALYKIPGLSEHFLYANDDMFLNRDATPSDFFTPEGLPIIRLIRRPMRKLTLWLKEHILHDKISYYNSSIQTAASLIKRDFGRYIGHKPHHNIDAYHRGFYEETFVHFKDELMPTMANRLRKENDIQRVIYSYYPMVEKKCKVEFVGVSTSFRLHNHRRKHYGELKRNNPMFFCLNDSQYATQDDRRFATQFLASLYPDKSEFEI